MKPIPTSKSVEGWEKVLIKEANEKLVEIKHSKIIFRPIYYLQGVRNSINKCFVRENVARLLIETTALLPNSYKLIIFDAWRPIGVQEALFEMEIQRIKQKNPQKKNNDLKNLTAKYVSIPSEDETRPSPHLTGGAVDISIVNNENILLDMGTDFDYFGPEARTDYYEVLNNKRYLTEREEKILKNRRFLYALLFSKGFTNYPEEWWHFDYGNQFWGKLVNKDAFYGKQKQ